MNMAENADLALLCLPPRAARGHKRFLPCSFGNQSLEFSRSIHVSDVVDELLRHVVIQSFEVFAQG